MVKDPERPMDRLCRKRDVGRAELLDALISKADWAKGMGAAAEQT